jgi:hypothetical protein
MQRGQGALQAQVTRLERDTRRNETIHVLALLLTGGVLALKFPQLSIEQLFGIFAINLYLNVYPIFLQRYNRFRLIRLMGKCTR